MTDDDIDEALKKNWIDVLNPYNSELIDQQMDRFADLTKSSKIKQTEHILKYQGKFYFIIGRYEKALTELTKLLEFDSSNSFALRYRVKKNYIIKKKKKKNNNLYK